MNTKNIFKGFALVAIAVSLLTGCTKGFPELNKDVFGVSDEQMAQDGLALGGMLQ